MQGATKVVKLRIRLDVLDIPRRQAAVIVEVDQEKASSRGSGAVRTDTQELHKVY